MAALARTDRSDIRRAWEALRFAKFPVIHTFIATSDIHLKYKLRKTRQEVLSRAGKAVRYAKTLCSVVEFSAEDATRSDIDFLCQVFSKMVEAGATTINIPDTVGYAIPWEFGELIQTIRQKVKGIEKVITLARI